MDKVKMKKIAVGVTKFAVSTTVSTIVIKTIVKSFGMPGFAGYIGGKVALKQLAKRVSYHI